MSGDSKNAPPLPLLKVVEKPLLKVVEKLNQQTLEKWKDGTGFTSIEMVHTHTHLCHTTLSHTSLSHATVSHTHTHHLSHTQLFRGKGLTSHARKRLTYPFSQATLSCTIFHTHTHVCYTPSHSHTQSFRHNLVAHHLGHTHTTLHIQLFN